MNICISINANGFCLKLIYNMNNICLHIYEMNISVLIDENYICIFAMMKI